MTKISDPPNERQQCLIDIARRLGYKSQDLAHIYEFVALNLVGVGPLSLRKAAKHHRKQGDHLGHHRSWALCNLATQLDVPFPLSFLSQELRDSFQQVASAGEFQIDPRWVPTFDVPAGFEVIKDETTDTTDDSGNNVKVRRIEISAVYYG